MVFPFLPQTNSLLDLIWLDLRSRKCLWQLRLTGNHHTFSFLRTILHPPDQLTLIRICMPLCISMRCNEKCVITYTEKNNHTYKYGLYRALFPRVCFMLPWKTWSNADVHRCMYMNCLQFRLRACCLRTSGSGRFWVFK